MLKMDWKCALLSLSLYSNNINSMQCKRNAFRYENNSILSKLFSLPHTPIILNISIIWLLSQCGDCSEVWRHFLVTFPVLKSRVKSVEFLPISQKFQSIWKSFFFFSTALSFMLMEIVCLSGGSLVENASERKRKKDIGLTSIYFYVKLYTFYYSHPATPLLSHSTSAFSHLTLYILAVTPTWKWYYLQIIQLSFHVR